MPSRRAIERQLYEELLAKYGQEVADAFQSLVNDLRSRAELERLIAAIERRDVDAAMDALHIQRSAYAELEGKLREAFGASGRLAVEVMPATASIGFRFNVGDAFAEAWAREHAASFVDRLMADMGNGTREVIVRGIAEGWGPRRIGLEIVGRRSRITGRREGGLLGMSASQIEIYLRTHNEALAGDLNAYRRLLGMALRDKRFDSMLRRAIREKVRIPAEKLRNILGALKRRMLQYRGEVIGRTEALTAVRAGKYEAWRQLVDAGNVADQDIERGWVVTDDGRQRHTHDTMRGQVVRGMASPFQSPSGAVMMFPGDTSLGAGPAEIVNCRCDQFFRIKRRWPL